MGQHVLPAGLKLRYFVLRYQILFVELNHALQFLIADDGLFILPDVFCLLHSVLPDTVWWLWCFHLQEPLPTVLCHTDFHALPLPGARSWPTVCDRCGPHWESRSASSPYHPYFHLFTRPKLIQNLIIHSASGAHVQAGSVCSNNADLLLFFCFSSVSKRKNNAAVLCVDMQCTASGFRIVGLFLCILVVSLCSPIHCVHVDIAVLIRFLHPLMKLIGDHRWFQFPELFWLFDRFFPMPQRLLIKGEKHLYYRGQLLFCEFLFWKLVKCRL